MTFRILMATAAVGLAISAAAMAATPATATAPATGLNAALPSVDGTRTVTTITPTTTTTTTAPVVAMTTPAGKTVLDLTDGNSDFSTLAKAIKAAGLEPALSAPGPITIFAPTNAAFAKLGSAKLNDLMKPENKAQLTEILTYHVVPQNLPTAPNAQPTSVTTAEGQPVSITHQAMGYQIQNARSLGAPMGASNGSIIAIDSVLMPDAQAKMATAPAGAPANPNAALPSVDGTRTVTTVTLPAVPVAPATAMTPVTPTPVTPTAPSVTK